MLNDTNPFDSAHEAQMAHFKISGTIDSFAHILDLQIFFGFKHEKHTLPLFNFTQRSKGLSAKTPSTYLFRAYG